jgi:hypothetical protein
MKEGLAETCLVDVYMRFYLKEEGTAPEIADGRNGHEMIQGG